MRKQRKKKVLLPSVNNISLNGQKTMSIYTRKGEKVQYCNLYAGLDSDRREAAEYLEPGKIYTVKKVSVYRSNSRVYLSEAEYEPGFNTVLFQNI